MGKVILLVSTQKGAFILTSDEHREDWKIDGPILKGWSVFDIAIDRRGKKPLLYAGVNHFVYGPTIQVSEDLGQSWRQIEHGPKYPEGAPHKLNNIWCITPGRDREPGVVYAGVDEAALFVSRDAGEHWEEMHGLTDHPSREEWVPGAGGLCCHSILLDPTNTDRMWVGISAVGTFRSEDAGKTWQTNNNGLEIVIEGKKHKDVGTCVHHMVLDQKNPKRLFQQNHMGVYRSYNSGDSWDRIENGIPHNFGFPMVILPHDSDTLFVVPQESGEFRMVANGQPTVYRTQDAGDSWHPLRTGLPEQAFVSVLRQAMSVDTCEKPGVYFGTTSGQLFFSRNAGDRWEALPGSLPRIHSVNAVVME